MHSLTLTTLMGAIAMLSALALPPAMAQSKSKDMSCKLKSDKVKGNERTCIYVCADKSLEGRTRTASNSCPAFVNRQKD